MAISGKVDKKIPISKEELTHIRKVTESIAINAGKILLNFRGKAQIIRSKTDALNIVTEADEASEKYILSELKKNFPKHNYLSEESGEKKQKSPFRWIIDPLDGTKEFKRGLFHFSVNIALEYDKKIIVGVVYIPVVNEVYSSALGLGSTLQGQPISVSKVSKLPDSIVVTHLPQSGIDKELYDIHWNKIFRVGWNSYRQRAIASDIFSLCWVALGAFEGFYVTLKYPEWWDIAPGLIIVSEAGGKITTAAGRPFNEENYKHEGILVTNGKIHNGLLRLLKE